MEERENLYKILRQTKEAIDRGDSAKIRNLSNQTINTASLTQDPDNIAVAVIVYALSKIVEREDYRNLPGWNNFHKIIHSSLEHAIIDLKEDRREKFRKHLGTIREYIGKLSGKLKVYIEEVFRRAQINKASRLYAHGISMEHTAKLLGISLFELAEYAGNTGVSDAPINKTLDVKSRVKLAMGMFE